MDQENQNTSPTTYGNSPSPTNSFAQSRIRMIIGIFVALLILAGLVYYARQTYVSNQAPSDIEALENQGNSDEVASIEEDLSVTDLDSLDQELDSIDAEFNASAQ